MVSKAQIQTEAIDISCDVVASVCWCIGVTLIAAPNGIAPCGISGIVVLLNYLFRLPIGATNLAFNIPLMYLAYRILGRKYLLLIVALGKQDILERTIHELPNLSLPAPIDDGVRN